MPTVSYINQPFGDPPHRIRDHLIDLLSRQDSRFNAMYMAVAFSKESGVRSLFKHLEHFISCGGTIEAVVGIDHKGTSRQALELLLQAGVMVYIFHDREPRTFHPKLFLFERKEYESIAFIGSNNLTYGGLLDNFELSIRLEHDLANPEDSCSYQELVESFRVFTKFASRLDHDLLEKLDRQCYLLDESKRPSTAEDRRSTEQWDEERLFEPVPIPRDPRPPRRDMEFVNLPPPDSTFTMTLMSRDTLQRPGDSSSIRVPLKARDNSPGFWGWPDSFEEKDPDKCMERWVNILVNPADEPTPVTAQVRLYEYVKRREFWLYCRPLVQGASPGDLLVISSSAKPDFDYEASIIRQSDPRFSEFFGLCTNAVPGSEKHWGYF